MKSLRKQNGIINAEGSKDPIVKKEPAESPAAGEWATPLFHRKRLRQLWQKGLDVLKPSPRQLAHGLALHRESVVCDTFGFLPMAWTRELFDTLNALRENGAGIREWRTAGEMLRILVMTRDRQAATVFIAALQASGVTGLVLNVGVGGPPEASLPEMAARAHIVHVFRRHLVQAVNADVIREAKKQKRMAVIWSINGPPGAPNNPGEMLKWLEVWYHFGIRLMHLSYNRRNAMAGGCTEERDDGLSDFGRDYIKAMNRLGVIVDTPHSSRQTVLDAARISDKPMMASHTGSRSLFDHPRCRTDEELKAIAGTGGMAGIYFDPALLGPNATLTTVLDHVDAAVKIIGVDHVGIGTDTCYVPGAWPPPEVHRHPTMAQYADPAAGWKPGHMQYATLENINGSLAWTNWPLLTVGLVMRGYKDDAIRRIIGANFLRVLETNRRADEVTMDDKSA